MSRTPYDMFMLRFHDYLKENAAFQANCPKIRMEFPPMATWVVFTDSVAHAALSGQYAVEQTFLIPPKALVAPKRPHFGFWKELSGGRWFRKSCLKFPVLPVLRRHSSFR